jgi:hypothetical protein
MSPSPPASDLSQGGRSMGGVETSDGWRPLTSPATGQPNAAFHVTPFMRLARTHAASTATDAMVAAALAGTIFFAAATGEARGKVFLYLLLTMAPFAVVAPLIGPALDRARSGRRWVVIGTAVARGVLCFALIGRADSLLLYPAAFGILVLQKAYGIARSSLVPAVVESDEELVEANSKLQLLSGIMGFVGAAPAALMFKIFGDNPSAPLAMAVLGFAVCAGLALRIPKVAVAPPRPPRRRRPSCGAWACCWPPAAWACCGASSASSPCTSPSTSARRRSWWRSGSSPPSASAARCWARCWRPSSASRGPRSGC